MRSGGRSYFVDEQGDRFPSVTTILNATKPWEEKQALRSWRARLGTQEANRITRNASRRGVFVHKQIHHYLLGHTIELTETVQPYWNSVQSVLSEIDNVRLIEGTVFHDPLHYSGRVDCVANYRGVPCILDWKTAAKPKSRDRLYDAPLQLTAYCGAFNQFYPTESLHHVGVVIALPDRPADVFWFEPEALNQYWQQWQHRVQTFWHGEVPQEKQRSGGKRKSATGAGEREDCPSETGKEHRMKEKT